MRTVTYKVSKETVQDFIHEFGDVKLLEDLMIKRAFSEAPLWSNINLVLGDRTIKLVDFSKKHD